jgi:serine/threonine protein kinase
MIGKTLAHYEITSQIGKGGMGEVYQAKDTKLGRDVAIKVLPQEFAQDADRVARFQREAKLLASLNHPNIAAIYGLEESGGTNFLVMELVEGNTLDERIKAGPIPMEEALKLALQIAEALEAAHEKGVIHRDLKPANIKVTPEGKVKVLDFGLAKAFANEPADLNLSNSPTLSQAATMQGVILGTAAYMSPEQARGKPVDKRTDIWAFGCVLYEMLTGKAAFQGEDVTEILAAVVKSGVNLDLFPANIHSRIREVITRCLQKEQKKRYPEISQAQYEIEQVLTDPSGVFVQPVTEAKPRKKLQLGLPWLAAVVVVSLIVAAIATWNLKPSEPRPVMRFDYELPEGQQFSETSRQLLTVSPDGSHFVYSTASGLYLRALDQPTARLIPGTDESSRYPLFSPDGKSICYFSQKDGQLKRIAVSGGASETLCSAQDPRRPTWGADGSIVYAQTQGIMQIPSKGGKPKVLINNGGFNLGEPQMLPGGKAVLFTIPSAEGKKVAVQSLESGERKELFSGDSARYLPTGHIIYSFKNTLFAIQFDPGKLELTGEPVSMVEDVLHGDYHSQYAVSDSGMLIYVPGTMDATGTGNTLVWVDRKGNETPIAAPPDAYLFPKISPDGKRVALTVQYPSSSSYISIWDLVGNNMNRLTFDEASYAFPLWSPDGKRIAFQSRREGKGFVYWKAADNTGTEELLVSDSGLNITPSSWANNGKSLIFMEQNSATNTDIGEIIMQGDRVKKPLLNENSNEVDPQISPDGRWMAYSSNKSGQLEIYVCPYPEGVKGGKWKVSTGGGVWPLWSPDGKELFYRNGDDYMAVSVKTDPIFSKETPRILFHGAYAFFPNAPLIRNWDISPEGNRFLMIKPPGVTTGGSPAEGPRRIGIIVNWFEKLKERAP